LGISFGESELVTVTGRVVAEACGPSALADWVRGILGLAESLTSPQGIAVYGVLNASGAYRGYVLETDAALGKAYISPNVTAMTYDIVGRYVGNTFGNAFTIQLNAYVAVRLADGEVQYYRVQNMVVDNGTLWASDLVINMSRIAFLVVNMSHIMVNVSHVTTYPPIVIMYPFVISPNAIRGNGGVQYYYSYTAPSPLPFGWTTLETAVGVKDGALVIRLYADGKEYDRVVIRPYAPAVSANIVVAPNTTPAGLPMDLELVIAQNGTPLLYTALRSGSIPLYLYVNADGAWVPPPSAWSFGIGFIMTGGANATVLSNGTSAVVAPGPNDYAALWSGTVVDGPTGVAVTTDTNLTRYLPQALDLSNGTRLLLEAVYVNGQPAPYSALGNVSVGSIVVGRYLKQYHGAAAFWPYAIIAIVVVAVAIAVLARRR
jgi:hypothetical protein